MDRRTLFYTVITAVALSIVISATSAPTGGTTTDSGGDYTTSNMIALILSILLALLFSFLCSIAESVLLNITPSYIADLRKLAKEIWKVRMEALGLDIDDVQSPDELDELAESRPDMEEDDLDQQSIE